MYIEQLYTNCLSEAAYYIESAGEAVVIDPIRDTEAYTRLAETRGARIRYIFETHFHADFISGHIELARKTGATIVYGPGAVAGYEIYVALDGEELPLGNIRFKVLHTPGHTLESCCFLLLDERNNPHSVFTGDTLFVGDVGRPDLAAGSGLTKEDLAGKLFESISDKLLPLPNYVVVYPGHGAGSACGKSIGDESYSTIGVQRQTNYALKAKSKEEFVTLVTEGLYDPPKYFFMDAGINKTGYADTDSLIERNTKPLSVEEVEQLLTNNAVVLDTRTAVVFEKAFIPGAINIGLDGSFAIIAGSILNPETKLIIVAEPGREREAILRLARIGFENVAGYLEGGIASWSDSAKPFDTIKSTSPEEFENAYRYQSTVALDVRNPDEWIPGVVAGARLIELAKLEKAINTLDKSKTCYVYCAGGYRSMIAASLLKRNGFTKVVNVYGGMSRIRKTKITIRQLTTTHH